MGDESDTVTRYDNVRTVMKTKHGKSEEFKKKDAGTSGYSAAFITICGCCGSTDM